MADIVQTLGFNVSEALDALSKLDKGLANFEKSLANASKSIDTFNKIGAQVAKANKTIEGSMNASAKATEKLTVSWGMMARIVTTQLIVRALSQLRRTFEETGEAAVAFERQIALIRTIDDSGASFGRTADAVRRLSDAYNISLVDAGAGVYQAISNQVGNFAESLEFTAEAARFAKATNSSLKDSVDLLSGALKSYNLTAADTAKVSGIFFSVIDKGRIEASQLAQKFGTIGPLAAQLGVSLEDVGGSLAAVSVKGSNTAHTLTMLKGILSGMQKPTVELTKELNKLGYVTPEAALATEHIDGLIRSLTAGKTSIDLGKLFPNLRATSGISSLASDFQTLANDIEAARKAGAEFAQEKFLTATATNAETVTKEINKLRNALTVDLGRGVLQAVADLSKFAGGAETVIQVASAAGPALLGLGAGFLLLRGKIAATRAELTGLSRALGLLALVPVAAGVGSSIGDFIGSKMVEDAQKGLRQLEKANEEALLTFKRQQSEKRDAHNKADEQRVQSALKAVRDLNKAYLSEVENAKRASDAIVKNAEVGLRHYLTVRERLVDELQRGVVEANNAVESSTERVADLTRKQGERDFARSISGLADPEKFKATLWRASDLAAEASKALSHAVDKDSISAALGMFEKAFAAGESAASIAERAGNRELEVKAALALDGITKSQISAEKQLQELQRNRATELEKQRVAQQRVVDTVRENIRAILDNSKLFDKQGQLLPADELAKMAGARQEALRKITESALTAEDLDLTKALGLADFASRFSAELSRDPVRLAFDTQEGLRKAQAEVEKAFQAFKIQVRLDTGTTVEMLEYALQRPVRTPDEVSRGLTELRTKAQSLRSEYDAVVAAQKGATDTLTATGKAAGASLDRIMERMDSWRGTVTQGFGAYGDAEAALVRFREALTDPNLNTEKLRSLVDAVKPLAERTGVWDYGGPFNVQNVTDFSAALEALIKRAEAMKTLQVPLPSTFELNQLESIIGKLKVPPELSNIGPAVQGGVQPSATIAQNLWSAAEATRQISANLSSSPKAAQKAHGGIVKYLSVGGRGTDTIPAMLSAGEFVVNARSARRFFPQLQAINAGADPVYRADGGNTTVNVGDINISESHGPKQTAREVMTAFRRELRRGSGRL